MLRAGSWFPRRGHLRVTLSAPLASMSDGDAWQRALALRDSARAHILAHCAEPDLAHESNAVDPT